METTEIAKKLKSARIESGYSSMDNACISLYNLKKIKLSRNSLSKYERDIKNCPIHIFFALLELYEKEPYYFFKQIYDTCH